MKIFLSLLLSMFLFTACEKDESATASTGTVHNFTLTDTKGIDYVIKKVGETITVKGHEGKVIIFDIFATWCPGCKVVAPHLSNLQAKYKKDLLVIGITIERNISNEKLDAFSAEHNAHYPISNVEENMMFAQRLAYDMKQPRSFPIPLVIMYGSNTKYFTHYIGPAAEEMMDRDIRSALGKK